MKCKYCGENVEGVINCSLYGSKGIMVCESCYNLLQEYRHKPYSKPIEKYCLKVFGYYYNRKLARSLYLTRVK